MTLHAASADLSRRRDRRDLWSRRCAAEATARADRLRPCAAPRCSRTASTVSPSRCSPRKARIWRAPPYPPLRRTPAARLEITRGRRRAVIASSAISPRAMSSVPQRRPLVRAITPRGRCRDRCLHRRGAHDRRRRVFSSLAEDRRPVHLRSDVSEPSGGADQRGFLTAAPGAVALPGTQWSDGVDDVSVGGWLCTRPRVRRLARTGDAVDPRWPTPLQRVELALVSVARGRAGLCGVMPDPDATPGTGCGAERGWLRRRCGSQSRRCWIRCRAEDLDGSRTAMLGASLAGSWRTGSPGTPSARRDRLPCGAVTGPAAPHLMPPRARCVHRHEEENPDWYAFSPPRGGCVTRC